MTRPRLRWKSDGRRDGDARAYLGSLHFGFIGTRDDGSVYWDATGAIQANHTVKTRGETTSLANARRCVNRAWSRWADRAGIN